MRRLTMDGHSGFVRILTTRFNPAGGGGGCCAKVDLELSW